MSPAIAEGRFNRLIDVATKIFVARGYRLTQMSDVADALGIEKGALDGYVESKEALFDGAVRFADDQSNLPGQGALPLPTPAAGSTVQYVRARFLAEVRELAVVRLISRPKETRAKAGEFESIVRDFYRRMSKNRRSLKLVERCAVDVPDLASVWYEQGRSRQAALLATYLENRAREGAMRSVPDVQLAARMVVETIALWAIHMPWDASPGPFAEGDVENAVVDMLVHAYVKET